MFQSEIEPISIQKLGIKQISNGILWKDKININIVKKFKFYYQKKEKRNQKNSKKKALYVEKKRKEKAVDHQRMKVLIL